MDSIAYLFESYVGVGKREEVQLFYYFVESQRNPQKDPLLLYLTGGPGTSGILPFLYQIGPLNFVYTNATRSDVKLELNPYSWTKTANVIFIDLPVGTGFSYVKANESLKNSDSLATTHAGVLPKLNIKGFLIVNPLTDKFLDFNSRTEFAYRAALIEYDLYKPAKENCGGKYINVDPNNNLCLDSLKPINESLSRVNVAQILEPICNAQDPKAICRESIYVFSNIWANTKSVRQALHIREGTVENFQFTNTSIQAVFGDSHSIYYTHDIFSSLAYHKNLLTKECRALIINGDHDMTFPYVGTQKWIKSFKLRVETPWKPWFVRNQVAGYEKTYSKAKYFMKYATIKGAGHSVAIYKPEEAMVIVETWLASHTNSTK
ncbi:peptidase S10, serine carboxypeptidase, Alpha/Beta hydrolase fold protein [Artemisia annua]|uniref:Peptidase S10, serine carboxypeptidase, Alpha/Beta hydrolase fold protein n=1 Tax=Artemisia annua TaxID=35608 RepID=A0A2U1L1E0_ARTAN|nr:peptidase S10, serine carboxypeptidase, Alpha/Beta hydrolase fold protein [Artemisia annua]